MSLLFFVPWGMLGWNKYHPLIELLGAGRFKMGEITQSFLKEIRTFAKQQKDLESNTKSPKSASGASSDDEKAEIESAEHGKEPVSKA